MPRDGGADRARALRPARARGGRVLQGCVRRGVLHQVGDDEIVAHLEVGDARFWVHDGDSDPESLGATTVRLLLVADDPGALAQKALAAGAKVLSPVAEEHGWLVGRIEDPFGHRWEIGKPLLGA